MTVQKYALYRKFGLVPIDVVQEHKFWQTITYFNQEMLKYGILASDRCYANLKHDVKSISIYKKACNDIRIVGSKFTTNAKVFTQKPTILLRIKRFFMQMILIVNYFLRGKKIPEGKFQLNAKKRY